ncbi:MAG: DUF1800 family protein [Saprospiraceae bacterium]|nr:DUF1800 family protein [Saprospiraceae bacterium]
MKKFLPTLAFIFTLQLVFSQAYTDYLGAGHAQDFVVTSSDAQSDGLNTVNGNGLDLDILGSSRFLARTTLGYTIEDIQELTEINLQDWIDAQIVVEPSYNTLPTIDIIFKLYNTCLEELGPECLLQFNLNTSMWRYSWWNNVMNGEDRLRQRIALALSEILVISDKSMLNSYPHGLSNYYDILIRNAFGNYKDILREVTLNPSMGFYLSHINNPRSFPSLNIRPDENYAREIMQLFSIGLFELNNDGTRKLDPVTGLWIPTYDNDDIKGLAKVFTGLSGSKWADDNNTSPVTFGRRFSAYSLLDPMKMYEEWHEPGEKHIVGDYTIPSGQTGMQDIDQAIDHLFNHPNVGPFLAYRLIQRLVKSNPSPEYIDRVASVFNNNGSGVRGDMAAMIRQIFMDEEALDCYWSEDEKNGMLRSPILRLTQLLTGLKAETENGTFWNSGLNFEGLAGQHPLGSPTVFNFYAPDYVPDAEFAYLEMVGPEFQILNSSTSSNYVNYMLIALMRDYINTTYGTTFENILNESFAIPYIEDKEAYEAYLSDPLWMDLAFSPEELVDYLDILLANGQLSEDTKSSIVESMKRTDIIDPMNSAYYAAYMIMIHPEYVIMK